MKSVREKVEKEIDKIIHTIEIWTRSAMKGKVTQNELYNLEQKLKKEATDKILSQLTLGEEEIVEILANAYAESNFCIPCRGLFALQASALSHKIPKKGWTSEELDMLEKSVNIIQGDKSLNHWSLQQHAETLKALDTVLNFCKQALLSGKKGEGR